MLTSPVMKILMRLWVLMLVAVPVVTQAQVTVSVSTPADNYLVYETVPVVVTVRNITGRTLELRGDEKESWLSFLVTDGSGREVLSTGKVPEAGTVLIPPGDSVSRTFNLTPLYELRERGSYRVRAEVTTEAIHVVSLPTRVNLFNGQEIWRQTVGIAAPGDKTDSYRLYRLLLKRGTDGTQLYVSVEEDKAGVVHGIYSLGTIIGLGEPAARVDTRGNLHVLHRNGGRTYGYHEIGPDAALVEEANYAELQSAPELVAGGDGMVTVQGGQKMVPASERILTPEELNPPPPPPAKPTKKWWQFWRSDSATRPAKK